jgi:N-acylneuraminate cytidylyltransferase
MTESYGLMKDNVDVVIGVKEVTSNPLYLLYQEDEKGDLQKFTTDRFTRRQDAPDLYEINGALYLFRMESILKKGWVNDFGRIQKLLMTDRESLDMDTELDWDFCEFLLSR